MMEIIKISDYNGSKSVLARDLHCFLESKQDFTTWIKNRIEKYGLEENSDFTLHKFMEGKVWKHEYVLSINAAKELAMVEGNEKGKQARQYFIFCEKRLKDSSILQIPQTYSEALRLAANQAEQIEIQQRQLIAQAPKALFADAVATSKKSCLIGELAKILNQNGVDIGQNRLFVWLRKNSFLCSKGEYYNQPTQRAMDMGLFEIKKTAINKPDGSILTTSTPKVTGKGQIYFINKFLNIHQLNNSQYD